MSISTTFWWEFFKNATSPHHLLKVATLEKKLQSLSLFNSEFEEKVIYLFIIIIIVNKKDKNRDELVIWQ